MMIMMIMIINDFKKYDNDNNTDYDDVNYYNDDNIMHILLLYKLYIKGFVLKCIDSSSKLVKYGILSQLHAE